METAAAESLPTRPQDDDVVGQASFNRSFQDFGGTLADNMYPVTLRDIQVFEGINTFPGPNNGKPRTQVVWLFTVDGREGEGHLAYYTSFSMHEKSKLPGLCTALGRQGPTEQKPSLSKSTFLGAKAKALVENQQSTKDATKTFAKITKLIKA